MASNLRPTAEHTTAAGVLIVDPLPIVLEPGHRVLPSVNLSTLDGTRDDGLPPSPYGPRASSTAPPRRKSPSAAVNDDAGASQKHARTAANIGPTVAL